ncbi:MAG: hypothetical protein WC712_06875 [Candidatus Brocadiia bacterium]
MDANYCKVEGCKEHNHAKGYCRKHYAKMWRDKGKASAGTETATGDPKVKSGDKASNERMRALQYELDNAKKMYDVVVGAVARIKWKKRISWLEHEILLLLQGSGQGGKKA